MSKCNWPGLCFLVVLLATGVLLADFPETGILAWQESTGAGKQEENREGEIQQQTADNNTDCHARLLEIAAEYRAYGRVDDETRWAPWLCRMPLPSKVRFSESDDAETHGQKLYYLFAKHRDPYMAIAETEPAVGQVVVKESWHPVEDTRELSPQLMEDAEHEKAEDRLEIERKDGEQPSFHGLGGGSYYPWVRKDEKLYHADELAGLYIMYKLDAATPGTDNGWVYGTVTADGETVTSAGRVMSCMSCHKDAPHDRLFGLQ